MDDRTTQSLNIDAAQQALKQAQWEQERINRREYALNGVVGQVGVNIRPATHEEKRWHEAGNTIDRGRIEMLTDHVRKMRSDIASLSARLESHCDRLVGHDGSDVCANGLGEVAEKSPPLLVALQVETERLSVAIANLAGAVERTCGVM